MPCTITEIDLAFAVNHYFQNYLATIYICDAIWPLVPISNVIALPNFLNFYLNVAVRVTIALYFYTSLWCHKKSYEYLKAFIKSSEGAKRSRKI